MNSHRPRVDMPRVDVICYEQLNKMARDQSQRPAWNRERLIRQFQGIDGSTRSEAERQVGVFERSFRDVFSAAPTKRDLRR